MVLKERNWYDRNRTNLAQDWGKWCAVVNAAMNLQVRQNSRNILTRQKNH